MSRSLPGLCAAAAAVAAAVCAIAAPVAAASSTLFTGQTLGSGQTLSSPDGHYTLTMQIDGNLVMSVANPLGSPRAIFSTGTGSLPGAFAELDSSGTFGVFSAAGAPAWTDNAPASGCVNVDVQTDGNVVAYNQADQPIWLAGSTVHTMRPGDELFPGQVVYSPDGGRYVLTMDAAGALTLADAQGPLWQSPQNGPPGSHAEMDPDGAWEIVSPSGSIVWTTGTDQDPGAYLRVTPGGALRVIDSSGKIVWGTGTSATRQGLPSLNRSRPFQSCPVAAPAPPPPSPPAPAPVAVKLPRTTVRIELRWRYDGPTSWVTAAKIRRFPRRARLTVSCRGRRCPIRRVTVHRRHHRRRVWRRVTLTAGSRHLRRLVRRLRTLRFHAGDRVVFTVTEPHHRAARSETLIRRGRRPRSKTLR